VNASYERDLDLNLLRVFVVVAETGSITGAASRLYLTQPAVSAAIGRLTAAVVSYNGDLRGIVEDLLGVVRKARVSVPTFHGVGAIVEGSALLATVPETVADGILSERPNLRKTRRPCPEAMGGSAMELVWRRAIEDDGAIAFVMDHVKAIAARAWGPSRRPRSKRRAGS
jgi:DNA-binding transcriptional LysR family regulator